MVIKSAPEYISIITFLHYGKAPPTRISIILKLQSVQNSNSRIWLSRKEPFAAKNGSTGNWYLLF